MIRRILFSLILFLNLTLWGQELQFTTYTYLNDDSTSLELSYFEPDSQAADAPLVIFLHGGGFSGGDRTHGDDYCRFMAENGIPAATISYTLFMKGKSFSCDGQLTEKIKAIQLAAYQTRIATNWFIEKSGEFGLDTTRFFLAGSSAGAEAVLQAAFWDSEGENFFPDTLSQTFKYAGVISGAGAVLDINMINESSKVPVISFHGTCDPLVPYHIAPHHYCSQTATGYMMFFGGLAIHNRLVELNESTLLMSYCNEGHKHAGSPFNGEGRFTVIEFMQRVMEGEKITIHRVFKNGEECDLGLEYLFCN